MTISVSDTRNVELEHVTVWKKELEDDLKLLRVVIGDMSRSLEKRWEIYLLIQPYLKTDGSYMSFDTIPNEISWYDDFYLERGETLKLNNEFIVQAANEFKLSTEQINSLQEEVLEIASKQGYGSFENDW